MIRDYKSTDLAVINALHANPAYTMPNLEHPLMLVRKVMVDENDEAQMAIFGRLHLNALLFVNHAWLTPKQRLESLMLLQSAAMKEARDKGLDIASTQMEGRFAERMEELGWVRAWGDMYLREIQP